MFAGGPVDAEDAFARKRRVVLCYDSQVDDAEVEQIASFSSHYGGRERLWANKVWVDCGLTAP